MPDITCIIVDDEPIARDILKQFVDDTPGLSCVGECASALEVIEFLKTSSADLLLLDINMPKLSGIELLKMNTIKQQVILTTAYPEYALDGYELNVVDYLLKPIAFPRFLKAIEKVRINAEEADITFTVKADGKTYRIETSKICFVESKGDYIVIHQEDEKVMVYMTMKKLLEQTRDRLVRVHKSFAVSVDHVKYVEGNMIHVGDKEIPIGSSFKEGFMNRMGS